MPPRVQYVGERTDADGNVLHDYADEQGNAYSVPAAALGPGYQHDLVEGFKQFQQQPMSVQDVTRRDYNVLAAKSRSQGIGLPSEDHLGVARPQFPNAEPFYELPQERKLGPRRDGSTLSDRPGVPVDVAVRESVAGPRVYEHEELHAQAYAPETVPGPARDLYYSMGPQGREQFRVYAADKATDHGHHDAHRQFDREKLTLDAVNALRRKLGL